MCLSVPRQVLSVADGRADVLVDGRAVTVLTVLPDLAAGDFVLFQAGVIVERLEAQDAQQILELFQEMASLMDESPDATGATYDVRLTDVDHPRQTLVHTACTVAALIPRSA